MVFICILKGIIKMFTKTQLKIMQLFVSHITKRFSLRGAGKELKMHQALTYRASKFLIKNKLIIPDDDKYILNYKQNHQELAYFEHLRSKEFLSKPKNKTLAIFIEDVIENFPYSYFTLLLFGSAVENLKPRDIDILVIIEKTEDIETAEKALYNLSRNYTLNLHTIIISFESVFEMLKSRDDKNVINLVLNKHFILYGAELFYNLIKRGRK
ncbi:MAG: hypothetical protein ABIF40_03640 [archaeon]